MPTAFYNAGMVIGIIAMSFMAIITVHCMHLLVRAGQAMTKKTNSEFLDYAEVVDATMETSVRLRKYKKVAK